jgi:hypothetical protein
MKEIENLKIQLKEKTEDMMTTNKGNSRRRTLLILQMQELTRKIRHMEERLELLKLSEIAV